MTIFKCKDCPRIKSGHPYKASGEKPWLCDRCFEARLNAQQTVSLVIPAVNTKQAKPILRLKAMAQVRR